MRNMKTLLSLFVCAAMLLGLCGCSTPAPAETVPASTQAPTEPPASDLYTQAAQPLRDAENLSVELTTRKSVSAEAWSFDLISEQELLLTGIGTDAFAASMSEDLEIGEFEDEFTEYYENGVLYVNIYDSGFFQGSMTEADFLARFAPAVLLDETLYATVSAEETETGVILTFSDPTGPESWALPEGAEFLDAGGTAKISAGGELTKTTYRVSYLQGGTTVSMEVSAEAELSGEAAPEAPADLSAYREVDAIDGLRLYETAIMYIYSAESVSSTVNQSIVSYAAGCTLSKVTELHYTGLGMDHLAEVRYSVNSTDSIYGSQTYSQTEHYEDGTYTYTPEDGASESDTSVTPRDMRDYLQSHYHDNLPALQYISSVSAEDVNGLLYLEMALNEEWGDFREKSISYMLFQDEDFLSGYASAYKTTDSTFFMVLDPATGFPLSMGITYSGTHTIDGTDYVLSMDVGQTYRLGESATHEEITGELLPEEMPETPATPLFYRVTGGDGQEMYLLGTIHVGDEQTAYLPDEIYEALDSADALAVEADIIAFEEKVENDPEFASQISMLYISPDGSTAKDRLDPEVYNKAVRLLKVSGNYSIAVEYTIPYFWENAIDNFYLSLSALRSDKGVDMRLLKLAEEQGKEIREVESGLFQMEMLTGFSHELQCLMLEEALAYTVAEYDAEVQALYELWCAGDETALRQELSKAPFELTEEELVLYEEYLDAMIIQRNKGMLDVAVSYLESGDTVFYAVGLAHLLQENGLVDTLRDAGYTVEPVPYQ